MPLLQSSGAILTIGMKVVLCLVKADATKAEAIATYVKLKV